MLERLDEIAVKLRVRIDGKAWPKTANSLSRKINSVIGNLGDYGIEMVQDRGTERTWTITDVRPSTNPQKELGLFEQEKGDALCREAEFGMAKALAVEKYSGLVQRLLHSGFLIEYPDKDGTLTVEYDHSKGYLPSGAPLIAGDDD